MEAACLELLAAAVLTAEKQLLCRTTSYLVAEPRLHRNIVIAAPHHAPGGVKTLPAPSHPTADQNTGFLARFVAEELGSASLVAVNALLDPNKSLDTDYSRQIIAWSPDYVVEIHGHDGGNALADVEISCGSEENSALSEALSGRLTQLCLKQRGLDRLTISGDFRNIFYKASRTATMTTNRWLGFHIELPLWVRKGRHAPALPDVARTFSHLLAVSLLDVLPLERRVENCDTRLDP